MHSDFINKLEEDLKPVLEAIEKRGLIIDQDKLASIIRDLRQKCSLAEMRAYELFGISRRINLNSSKELAELLAELNIEGVRLPKTKRGSQSTAKDVLERINHPAIEHVIKYRSMTKLMSSLKTYHSHAALDYIENPKSDLSTDRLYFEFTNHCASGRLYTKNISIQNLPHAGRFAITPGVGKVFVSADYDAFELRILSALSGDVYFRQCWGNGIDLHRKVVADMKGIAYEDVSDTLRKLGKVLNFGITYGQEPPGIAQRLDISINEARKLFDDYLKNIPEIVRFKEECQNQAEKQGYIETYFGRRRNLPDIKSDDFSKRLKAKRQAVNSTIQGTGADIAKITMLKLHQANLEINAMVHDSFLISVPSETVQESIVQIREIMEMEINGLKFTISFKIGNTWGDCK